MGPRVPGPSGVLTTIYQGWRPSKWKEHMEDKAEDHPKGTPWPRPVVANPIKLSDTPVDYRRPPPLLGEHTREVLREVLEIGDEEIDRLARAKAI